MNTTLFLASIWGPALLAVTAGVFSNKAFYSKVYRDLEKDVLAVFLTGMVLIVLGLVQIQGHNVWGTLPEKLISLLGWGSLVKGLTFVIAPGLVDSAGDRWAKYNLIPLAGVAMLVIGGYLTYIAYLA